MRSGLKYLLLVSGALYSFLTTAQPSAIVFERGKMYRFELNNGEMITGFVAEFDDDWLTVEKKPDLVRVEIRRTTIKRVTRVSTQQALEDDVFGENPHAESYMTCGSALPMKEEELSGTAHWFLFDQSQYAFSKHWAIQASSVLFYPFGIGVKCSYPIDEMNHLGASVNGFLDVSASDRYGWAAGFSAMFRYSHGGSNRNFTIGAGFLGANERMFAGYNSSSPLMTTPMLSAGYCNRVSKKWSLVMDGHLFPDDGLMIGGAGLKYIRDESSCWTAGCYLVRSAIYNPVIALMASRSIPLPYFSFSRKFN